MSASNNMQYMYASSSDVVIATVIFSVLMTLLIINIVFYLICKYLSRRPSRNLGLDTKQVKRIRVKSASQISKDFEKESMRLLMKQLRRPSSQSEISAVYSEEETADFKEIKNVSNTQELSVNVEPHRPCASVKKVVSETSTTSPIVKNISNCSDNSISTTIDDILYKKDKKIIQKKTIRNGVNKGGNSSNTDSGKTNNCLKAEIEVDDNINTVTGPPKNGGEIKTGSCSKKSMDDISIEDCSETDYVVANISGNNSVNTILATKDSEISQEKTSSIAGQQMNHHSSETNLNIKQQNLATNSVVNKMADYPRINCLHDNHLINNTVAITITTDDGLQSSINFGSEMDLSISK